MTGLAGPGTEEAATRAAPGAEGKTAASCPSCRATFLVDERASIVSVRDATMSVRRPDGLVIVEGATPDGSIYRSAHEDVAIRLTVVTPHFGRFGPIVLTATCAACTIVLMHLFRGQPLTGALPLAGAVGVFVFMAMGYRVWPKVAGPSHELRLTRDALIAVEHGREVARLRRDEIARASCIAPPAHGTGQASEARCRLAAFDRAGGRFPLWEDVPAEHGVFAELWLEEKLGLADRPASGGR